MTYKEYIDLGFSRYEMDCGVTFDETGYGGFALTKNINEKMMIEVGSDDLNSPKLYILKSNGEQYHIFKITPEAVKDLLSNNASIGQTCVVPDCKKEAIQGAFHGLCSQHIWPNG